ncbi:MAG: DUF3592 domain-containing protein [Minisyncoccia bacterium]
MTKGVFITIWLILAVLLAVGIGSLNTPTFWRLTKHASRCQGTVTEVTVEHHNTVRYQYTVSNRVYAGQTQTGAPNREAGKLRSGDALVVFFDSDAPGTSVLEAPDSLLKNEVISWGLAALVMPSLMVFGLKRGLDRNRRKANQNLQGTSRSLGP